MDTINNWFHSSRDWFSGFKLWEKLGIKKKSALVSPFGTVFDCRSLKGNYYFFDRSSSKWNAKSGKTVDLSTLPDIDCSGFHHEEEITSCDDDDDDNIGSAIGALAAELAETIIQPSDPAPEPVFQGNGGNFGGGGSGGSWDDDSQPESTESKSSDDSSYTSSTSGWLTNDSSDDDSSSVSDSSDSSSSDY